MNDLKRTCRQKILREAEAYLELIHALGDRFPLKREIREQLACRALQTLQRITDAGGYRAELLYLEGQALRSMERYGEAIFSLREASALEPQNVHIYLALGWCYKRIRRLDLAIESLEEALAADASIAIVHYNLACYWSLAGNAKLALLYLARSLDLDPNYRDQLSRERDFDPIRHHPNFLALSVVVA